MSKVNETSGSTYFEDVSTGLVLVDVYAPWCAPCKMMSPLLDKLADSRPDLKVLKLNIDESPELARELKIRGVPTLIFYNDGNLVSTKTGGCTLAQITQFVTIQ